MVQQAFALLCALAAVALLASAGKKMHLAWALGGTVVGATLLLPLPGTPRPLIDIVPAQVALLLALLAFGNLRRPLPASLLCTLGGILAVVWCLALFSLGYPRTLAPLLVGGFCVIALHGALWRPAFRSGRLLEEAFVLLLLAALAQAIVPEIVEGWRAASGLQGGAAVTRAEGTLPMAPLALAGAWLLAGSVFALWRAAHTRQNAHMNQG